MAAQNVFFYVIAAVMAFSAIRVVTVKNVVHAAMYLMIVLAGVAAQYILLASEFVAATQVLVYIGAIVVLVLFGVMLTRAKLGQDVNLTNDYWYVGAFTSIILFAVMASSHSGEDLHVRTILGTYLVPFEAVSVLLLAALVGAIVLARKD